MRSSWKIVIRYHAFRRGYNILIDFYNIFSINSQATAYKKKSLLK
jgi:hypothetical protein